MKIAIVLFLFSLSSYAGEAKKVISKKLLGKKCNPCSLEYKDTESFNFAYEKINDQKLRLTLNEKVFDLDVELAGHKFKPVPFFQIKFKEKPDLKLFGFLAEGAINNKYYHYFIKEDKKFVYLGRYADLAYDEKKQDFFSVEIDSNSSKTTRYKLNGKKLSKINEVVDGGKR